MDLNTQLQVYKRLRYALKLYMQTLSFVVGIGLTFILTELCTISTPSLYTTKASMKAATHGLPILVSQERSDRAIRRRIKNTPIQLPFPIKLAVNVHSSQFMSSPTESSQGSFISLSLVRQEKLLTVGYPNVYLSLDIENMIWDEAVKSGLYRRQAQNEHRLIRRELAELEQVINTQAVNPNLRSTRPSEVPTTRAGWFPRELREVARPSPIPESRQSELPTSDITANEPSPPSVTNARYLSIDVPSINVIDDENLQYESYEAVSSSVRTTLSRIKDDCPSVDARLDNIKKMMPDSDRIPISIDRKTRNLFSLLKYNLWSLPSLNFNLHKYVLIKFKL